MIFSFFVTLSRLLSGLLKGNKKRGKLLISHRYNLLPLLRSRPGGVQRELVVQDLPQCESINCFYVIQSISAFSLVLPLVTMYKTSLNIGTLAGIIAFSLFVALYYIGLSPLGVGKFLGFWIPIGAVIWATIKVRDKDLGGTMTYMQAFLSGTITILTWASFKGFCIFIFITSIDHGVVDQYIEFTQGYLKLLEGTGNDALLEQIDMEEIKAAATPWNLMVGDIFNNTFFGTFVAFIVAFITKRSPK